MPEKMNEGEGMFQRRKKDIQERGEAAIRAVLRQKTRGKEREKIGIEYDPMTLSCVEVRWVVFAFLRWQYSVLCSNQVCPSRGRRGGR